MRPCKRKGLFSLNSSFALWLFGFRIKEKNLSSFALLYLLKMLFQIFLFCQRVVEFIRKEIFLFQLVIDDIRLIKLFGMEVVQNSINGKYQIQKTHNNLNYRSNMPSFSHQLVKYQLSCRLQYQHEFHQKECTKT